MENHVLKQKFTEHIVKINELKISNNHFKKLFKDYHGVNKSIYNIEKEAVHTTDLILN